MAVFETSTPDGYRQLSSDYRYFRLEQKLTLDESGWTSNNTIAGAQGLALSKTVYIDGVTMNDAPVVALSCSAGTFATVAGSGSGINITVFRITKSSPPPVTMYAFSTRRPPDGPGLSLYDAGGGIVYSISTPIVKPLGTFDNNGYSGIDLSGRVCAHIPQRRGVTTERFYSIGGLGSCSTYGTSGAIVQGYQTYYRDTNSVRFVACSGSSVLPDSGTTTSSLIPYYCNSFYSVPPGGVFSSSINYRSLIIDVTNF